MKAGNKDYNTRSDLPDQLPVFPLAGAILLPGGQLPLNIFERQYLQMFEDALLKDRLIAMIQPHEDQSTPQITPKLYEVGCLGRITAFQETGDGRYWINLAGICRYKISTKLKTDREYDTHKVEYFEDDLADNLTSDGVDREKLLKTFRNYLEANQMEADWQSVEETNTDQLVNALCMMSPYGPAEKQALLEAGDLALRAETLIAITEFELAKNSGGSESILQ
ncbi:MAG: LON peptidase substrate-binding domain-containing protein [Rhizobiaceae bacterium]|nr:LON peptidase substrate-binding domain-containing protein [Rhizobiaceae bacterium]